jgi:hypothetical protein
VDYHLAPHAVWAGRAAEGIGDRTAAWGASAPLAGASRAVGHAEAVTVVETVAVSLVEQVVQAAGVATEQQPRDVSHLRLLVAAPSRLVATTRYNANAPRR